MVVAWLTHAGYWAVFWGMVLESAGIPLPSEVILPFGGYLVAIGRLTLIGAFAAALAGGVVGGVLLYGIGLYGGRPLVVRYGRYVFIREKHLDEADRWFTRYGGLSVFVGRLLPIVRTYISLPAGVARMPFWRFVLYSVVGSLPWTLALLLAGRALGGRWHSISHAVSRVDAALVLVVVVAIVLAIWLRRRQA
jgi:membrane protein DedA with SNARE-associated domain